MQSAQKEDSDGTGYCRGCGTTIGEPHHWDCEMGLAYQRGLNDGLEQAARICDHGSNFTDDKNSMTEFGAKAIALANEISAAAIRAQIKK